MSVVVGAPPVPEQPYRGIQPFRFIDQQIFVARDEDTWNLLSNVTLYRAVLLYGESGTGKSSLINAGFLPRALEENYLADRIRVQPLAGREIKVERIRMSGPNEPVAYLPSNFASINASDQEETFELSLPAFRERLEEFRARADASESQSPFQMQRSRVTPLLIFDQFEEFITLFEEVQRSPTGEDPERSQERVLAIQETILKTLVDLIQDANLSIKIIFSFREDYLAKLSLLFDFCPELIDHAQRLRPPRVEVLPQIIRAPFDKPELRAHFLKSTGRNGSELSESLAQQIAADLGRRSEAGLVNLSALQIVCQRLWASPDARKLYEKSGLAGLLKDYGEDVFRDVNSAQRETAVLMLGRMLTGANTRNIVSEDDLVKTAEQKQALALLVNSQIVRREMRRSIYFYEITSEYLVPWIKDQVVEQKAAEQRRLADIQRQQAEASLETQRRRSRFLTKILVGMVLLLVVVVVLGLYARGLYKRAEAAEAELQKRYEDVEYSKREVEQSRDSLKGALITATKSEDEQVAEAASEVLAQAIQTDQSLARQIPARFYIHAAENQKEQAEKLTNALKGRGYIVPGIDTRVVNQPPQNELRYFRQQDPGMPVPADVVNLLNEASGINWIEKYTAGYENSPNIRPGHFEIWFAAPPGSEFGWLRAWPVDERNNRISGLTFYITVTSADGKIVKKQRSGYMRLPYGDYVLKATAEGYEPAELKFSIERDKESFQPFRFTKTNRTAQ